MFHELLENKSINIKLNFNQKSALKDKKKLNARLSEKTEECSKISAVGLYLSALKAGGKNKKPSAYFGYWKKSS